MKDPTADLIIATITLARGFAHNSIFIHIYTHIRQLEEKQQVKDLISARLRTQMNNQRYVSRSDIMRFKKKKRKRKERKGRKKQPVDAISRKRALI